MALKTTQSDCSAFAAAIAAFSAAISSGDYMW